jgi:hypothetical protein
MVWRQRAVSGRVQALLADALRQGQAEDMAAAYAPEAILVIVALADAAAHDAIARGFSGPKRRRRPTRSGRHGRGSLLGQIELFRFGFIMHGLRAHGKCLPL